MLPSHVRPFITPSVRRVYIDGPAQSQTLQQELSAAQNEVKILTQESAQLRTSYASKKRKFEEAERGWKDKHDQLTMSYSAKKLELKQLSQEMTKRNQDLAVTARLQTNELARIRRERAAWIQKYGEVKTKIKNDVRRKTPNYGRTDTSLYRAPW
ncbi:hypothetical protein BDP27DRAFT_1319026 [Rhodocollybia butyracea]|uniref:Uncharacterized protein n=1 Tax=Rhodocollybia butyracea TaxID=206335 RepID=A0A9P5Q1M6_9AGAR|nr:hypothetical protein BDP27DRAFT_1319026 [Rhodocollybia butyracea]